MPPTIFFFLAVLRLATFQKIAGIGTHLNVLGKHIVRVEHDGTEIANRIEFKDNFNRFAHQAGRIVSPANPFIS